MIRTDKIINNALRPDWQRCTFYSFHRAWQSTDDTGSLTVTMISRICIDIRKAGLPRKIVGCGSDTFLRTVSPVQFADLEDIQVVEFTGALTVDAGGG